MRLFWSYIFLGLFMLSFSGLSYGDPPEKKSRSGNSFLLHTISKIVLIDYSKGLLQNVEALEEQNKDQLIEKSANATVAIILYEFASGLGPSTRYFHDGQPFVGEIRNGPAMRWVMHQYISGDCASIENLRYQFSPLHTPFRPKTWPFSIKQHALTLSERNISQFVLGSFNVSLTNSDDDIYVHIWNTTSSRSLFLGFGPRIQRPLPFGNVNQHIFLKYTRAEAEELASEK